MIRLYTDVLHFQARVEEVNAAMKAAAEGPMKGYLACTEEELVSSDMRGNPHSPVFSAVGTVALGDMANRVDWYDNEQGYAFRTADMCGFMAQKKMGLPWDR
ncbi:MAG: hypothetical protein AB7F50_08660 [Fimbriimonadaceae bacterium]